MGILFFRTTADCHPALLVIFPISVFNLDFGFVTYSSSSAEKVPGVLKRFSDFCPICDPYHPVVDMVRKC